MAAPETANRAPLRTLKTRAEFLRAARASRANLPALGLQGRDRESDDPAVGVGFTCSRKVGNAVARNRAKRRLRAVAREVLPREGRAGWDYVLIGRPGTTAERPYARLVEDLSAALRKVHRSDAS